VGGGGGSGSGSSGRPSRLYLQMRVRHHPLWQNLELWESAIMDGVGSDSLLRGGGGGGGGSMGGSSSSSGSSSAHGPGSSSSLSPSSSAAAAENRQALLLGQLGFFAFNMVEFCVPEEAVRRVLEKYARFVHLDVAHVSILLGSLGRFGEAARRAESASGGGGGNGNGGGGGGGGGGAAAAAAARGGEA